MKQCKVCGLENSDSMSFCQNCGTYLDDQLPPGNIENPTTYSKPITSIDEVIKIKDGKRKSRSINIIALVSIIFYIASIFILAIPFTILGILFTFIAYFRTLLFKRNYESKRFIVVKISLIISLIFIVVALLNLVILL